MSPAPKSRSLAYRRREQRAITANGTWSGWNTSLMLTGVVPPHGYDALNLAGVNVTPKTVLSIGIVQRCLEVIQNALFVMGHPRPYKRAFHQKSGLWYRTWVAEDSRQYPPLLRNPWGRSVFADNAYVPYNVGIGKTAVSMGLFGEAWWLIVDRATTGNASALEPLHPAFITMRVTENAAKLNKIVYGMGAKQVELTPADLVHIPRMILPGDRGAVNPIRSESPMFAIAIAAVQYSQMWFAQGGQPSYIFSTEQKLGQDAIDRIFKHVLLEHSGLQKAYTPLIVDSGIKPEPIQADPDRSQMNQTLQYVRSEIAGYFGIPLHLVGATGDSGMVWGKGIQEENFSLLDFTLSGYRVPIEEAFSQVIDENIFAALDQRALLRANSVDQSHLTQANRMSAVTMPDEERIRQDLLPLDTTAAQSITTHMNSVPAPATAAATAGAVTAATVAAAGTSGGTSGGTG